MVVKQLICLVLTAALFSVAGSDVDARPKDRKARMGSRVRKGEWVVSNHHRRPRDRSRRAVRAPRQRIRNSVGDLYSYSDRFRLRSRKVFVRSSVRPTAWISVQVGRNPPVHFGGTTCRFRGPRYVSVSAPLVRLVPLPTGGQTNVIRAVPHYDIGEPDVVDAPDNRTIGVLPPGFDIVVGGDDPVYGVEGRFYRFDVRVGRYVEVAPEPGWTIRTLPPGFETLHYKGEPLYRIEETYLRYNDATERYVVVLPPQRGLTAATEVVSVQLSGIHNTFRGSRLGTTNKTKDLKP